MIFKVDSTYRITVFLFLFDSYREYEYEVAFEFKSNNLLNTLTRRREYSNEE